MEDYLQPIFNGILLGGLYAAVGVGLSMIFGIVKQVNLAHGDLMIVASYLTMILILGMSFLTPWTALILVIPAMFLIGFLIQKYLLNRVLGLGMEPPLIVTFGLSIIIQNGLLVLFSPDARLLETPLAVMSFRITDLLYIPVIHVVACVVGVALVTLLHFFFSRTFLGRAIRAASDDENAAQLMGIDTQNIYAWAHTGPQYLIIAFGVVIIGGVGSMAGTLLGGFVLGLSQLLGGKIFGPGYQLLSGYIILLVLMAIRPQGLLGRAGRVG
jgi:branched-chain amino acid transport system permease protein